VGPYLLRESLEIYLSRKKKQGEGSGKQREKEAKEFVVREIKKKMDSKKKLHGGESRRKKNKIEERCLNDTHQAWGGVKRRAAGSGNGKGVPINRRQKGIGKKRTTTGLREGQGNDAQWSLTMRGGAIGATLWL